MTISLQSVSKSFLANGQRRVILNDVSFDFPQDRNIAIMGRNGAGKSTLMRLLSGSDRPDRGRIHRTRPVSWPLGFSSGFNSAMTGVENILFVSRLYGQDTEAVLDYVAWFSELGEALRLPVRTYSSGMRARLAFGLSMAIPFQTYLIDEITAVGDAAFRRKCQEVFEHRLAGANIFMVSHSTSAIKAYCGCGVILEKGQLEYHDNIDDLLRRYDDICL